MWGVATVAQEWRARFQQRFCGRAVRVVAVGAVFIHRLMVMHKRATLFHVAGVAGLNHTIALHEAGAGGTVHVVAIRAAHLAFEDRVVRGLAGLRTLFFV